MPKKSSSMDFGHSKPQAPAYTLDALPPGTRLGGYQILEVIGRGGFGIVYLALDASLQRQVAIKEYLPAELAMRCEDGQVWVRPGADPAAYAAGMTAFLNEAKMLARFDHPSLARVLSFWEENRSAYMVMPYYDGRTLGALLAEMKRPPDEAWLRSLLVPLLSALSALHNAQCLHLDISPDNIIVLSDGRPVLLDFGVASRLATDKTMPLTALLNPAYAPIEQYSETPTLPQGPWSDLYALAGVLHFAIVGVPPARATVRAVEDPQRPLADVVAERARLFPGLSYSPSFLAAIDKALAVKPRDRVRHAADFQHLIDHMPPSSPDVGGMGAMGAMGAAGATAAQPGQEPPVDFMLDPPSGAAPAPAPGATAPREAWFAAEPMDAPPRPTRSRTPLWIAAAATVALVVGVVAWIERQSPQATITVADLPAAVVARIPKAASAAMGDGLPGSAAPVAPTPAPQVAQSGAAPQAAPAAPVPAPVASAPAEARTDVAAEAEAAPPGAGPAQAAAPAPAPTPAPTPAQVPAPPPANDAATARADTGQGEAAPAPARSTRRAQAPKPAPADTATATASRNRFPPEPSTPRGACGTRSNFALVYCMQQQCKRWKFNNHPECLEMERRGDL